ncbi:hypothetical protein [Francisella salimarina]|uniref:Uncharacterized protein n=1 Tax=Francisella salimarina TaxID=2599927 RepID=A0AAJ4TKK7_9GAMM|nr:hypothetical protein [Francisella salimarina]QWU98923.1 hypothetical protein KQR59_07405 [Francisella salimarina]
MGSSGKSSVVFSVLITFFIFAITLSIYTPIFETNDDVGLSMISAGYGIAANATPNLTFSNALYGEILNHLPVIAGILPYSYMTFFALFVASYTLLDCLSKFNVSRSISCIIVLVIFVRAISMPQFTVNSGLLALASVLSLLSYNKEPKLKYAFLFIILAFYSYLIRYEELYFVYLVAIPFILSKELLSKSSLKLFMVLLILCLFAKYFDSLHYSMVSFDKFNGLKKYLSILIDYGGASYLIQHPELLKSHGYSVNDMSLIRAFVFIDPYVVNQSRLHDLLVYYTPTARVHANIWLGVEAIRSIFSDSMSYLVIFGLSIVPFSKHKYKLIFSWVIFSCLIAFLGIEGRPSILRVYYAVICLLALLPLISLDNKNIRNIYCWIILVISSIFIYGINSYLAYSAIVLAIVFMVIDIFRGTKVVINIIIVALFSLVIAVSYNYELNRSLVVQANNAQNDYKQLPKGIYYIFGDSYPFQYIYTPFDNDLDITHIKLNSFGGLYYMPGTNSYSYSKSGESLHDMFKSSIPVKIIANQMYVDLLSKYCSEHYSKSLDVLKTKTYSTFTTYVLVCK